VGRLKLVGAVALAAIGVVVWKVAGSGSETEQLQDAFNETTNCSESGIPSMETIDGQELARYIDSKYEERRFARYVLHSKPELTIISCQVAGPGVRYFAFAGQADARGAVQAHEGEVCIHESVVLDLGSGHLPEYCDELSGTMTTARGTPK
jgi:hypothetical protein